jgi:succinate dehydrogenase / fumarate reductase cytochrome b subunit
LEAKRRPKLYRNMPGLVRASVNPFLLRLRNNPERIMFVLHRITGVIIIGYLMLHVIVTSFSVDAQRWDALMEEFGSSLVNKIGEFIVAGAVIFHGLNGIRLLLVEFFGLGIGKPEHPKPPYIAPSLRAGQRTAIYAVVILWLIAWFFAGVLIFTGSIGFG